MNLLLLTEEDFDSSNDANSAGAHRGPRIAVVEGERLRHIRQVLRVQPGDLLKAGVLHGDLGQARVLAVDRSTCRLEVALSQPPPPPLDVSLVLALPRPKFLGRILQSATAMGVKRIALVNSARVEKSFWQSSLLEPERLQRHLLLGLAQGRDTVLPELEMVTGWQDLAESLPHRLEGVAGWVADGDARRPFPATIPEPAVLAIGPEGGWIDREVSELAAAGFEPRTLGPRPLRVETAVAVTLGRIAID